MDYINTFQKSFLNYFHYVLKQLANPSWHNFYYWFLGLSIFIWLLELAFPWRKKQGAFRKDFWLDAFYMAFNLILFSLIGYHALSMVVVKAFNSFLQQFGLNNPVAIHIESLPSWLQLTIMFILRDFIQWNIHRLLHRIPFLWEFHKVHHSVKEMGFAAHFRFHWMETVVYSTLQYLPLAMIGYSTNDFFIVYIISIAIGHLNHSNIPITYGPLKYVLNNPVMHLIHHAKSTSKVYGVNFGLSLSIWDYLFGTADTHSKNENLTLGFEKDEAFPKKFLAQLLHPFKKTNA